MFAGMDRVTREPNQLYIKVSDPPLSARPVDGALTARARRRGPRTRTAPCCRRSWCRRDTRGDSARAAPARPGLFPGISPGSGGTPSAGDRDGEGGGLCFKPTLKININS